MVNHIHESLQSGRGCGRDVRIQANHVTKTTAAGRGIKVCEQWRLFSNFLADVGERPSKKYSLERIDNERDYEPDNVKWATRAEQSRNNRRNIVLEFNGKKMVVMDWAKELGVNWSMLYARIRLGWSVERILTTPVRVRTVTRS